ncbi:MAG: hypothetical protein CVT92_03470 [Bacteroidetes bacterium HGW-Bacteroidetes-1]|jgi:signal transduction histidine kinase/ActR/RegA family two-component response regulator|nr:MAG: hypothetical protein CVT92_03470 [Bacteroidetes bacterium HGW-Bacteroidetes-1]
MKILVLTNDNKAIELLKQLDNQKKYSWTTISPDVTGEIIQALAENSADVIMINPIVQETWNIDKVHEIAGRFPFIPIIVFCTHEYEPQALKSLEQSVWDYFIIDSNASQTLSKTLQFNLQRIGHHKLQQKLIEEMHEAKNYSNRLLARMSHEIRTPMNAVIGMTEMLRDTELNSKQRYYIQTIFDSGTLLVALFNDLLDFSKIEAGTIHIHNKPFNLIESIRESITNVLESALDKRLELIYRINPSIPFMVMGDDLRVRQIVMNLLDNAIKFTVHGYVKLEVNQCLKEGIHQLCISVEDTGPGMRSDLLPHLFKPYVQASGDESIKKKGIGLGLAICDHLIKRMNGSIEVNSILGKGSVFTIHIPFQETDNPAKIMPVPELNSKKVLYVTNDGLLDEMIIDYCTFQGMPVEIIHSTQEYPDFSNLLNDYNLLITQLHTGMKMDLKLIDTVRNVRAIPQILIKERENVNEKMIVIRKDAVIMLKPLDYSEFIEVMEAVLSSKADALNMIERHMQIDDHLGEHHPLDILVAEDNTINQRIIMSVLNRYDYQVKMVENGKEAIESLERRVYDVVLMDIQMPVMDGITATKKIREQFHSDRQPYIIALTADALQQSRTDYLKQGMNEVLYKPVQTKALMLMLAACERLERNKKKSS